jgi:hypothetical protein
MARIAGVDVSSYQNSTYDTSGMAFSIVKATEGTGYVNPEYTAQVAHARAGGLVVGHYHYLDGTDASAEFAHFAAVAVVVKGDIIALDWEASVATAAARDEWLAAAKAHYPHNRVVLYCDVDFWDNLDPTHSCADGLWIADYNGGSEPHISQPWVFWQYSSANGIDHSYGNFSTLGELVAWCLELSPATKNQDEDMAFSVNYQGNKATAAWPSGAFHAVGVTYDGPAQTVRVVAALKTGPLVLNEAWTPKNGCDSFQIPADHVAACQGVILEASSAVEFAVTAA